jgi:hypothetical protein
MMYALITVVDVALGGIRHVTHNVIHHVLHMAMGGQRQL